MTVVMGEAAGVSQARRTMAVSKCRHRGRRLPLVICLALAGYLPAAGEGCPELVSSTGGSTDAVAAEAGLAYVSIAGGLSIFDVADPIQPLLLGRVSLGTTRVGAVAIADGIAWLHSASGLTAVDVTLPESPQVLGSVSRPGAGGVVAVPGGLVYVADGDGGLTVVDGSVPADPRVIGRADTPGSALGVAVSGSHAFVADGSGGLRTFDVTDPSQPLEIGAISGITVYAVASAANRAYFTYFRRSDATYRVGLLDVSVPASPVPLGDLQLTGSGYPSRIAVAGHRAYVIQDRFGVLVIDGSSPQTPVLAGSVEVPGNWVKDVAAADGHVFVASEGAGLRVVRDQPPASPQEVAAVDPTGVAQAVGAAAGAVYVGDFEGLQLLTAADPTRPVEAGFLDTPGTGPFDLAVVGAYAYLANYNYGLQVVDVSSPQAPVARAQLALPGLSVGVAVAKGYAFVAAGAAGVHVVDVSTAHAPRFVGSVDTPGKASGIAVSGDWVYVADGPAGLQVIDVSDPEAPVLVAGVDTPGSATGIAVANGIAYVAADTHGLRVIDVSLPIAPVEIASLDAPGLAYGVAVQGRYVYLASGWLRVIDVGRPTAPVAVGLGVTLGPALDVAVVGDAVYVAADSFGLATLHGGCLEDNALAVTTAGGGSGTVVSVPAGIDCGADCAESYAPGTVVTLSANPAAGSRFAGWSGACSGTATCSVAMSAKHSVTATFERAGPACADDPLTMCLHQGRFRVGIAYRLQGGETARARVAVEGTRDSGLFYYTNPNNWEFLLKVLDGCQVNDHFWVFFAATTNQQFTVTVTDTVANVTRTWDNPAGHAADAVADTTALATCHASSRPSHVLVASQRSGPTTEVLPALAASAMPARRARPGRVATTCTPAEDRLCLLGGRFSVEVDYQLAGGQAGRARVAAPHTSNSGLFYYTNPNNWELLLKVLDGCALNDRFWVLFAATTNQGFTVTVSDHQSGAQVSYQNPIGHPADAVTDTQALQGCP
jgi:hypothetical protein